MALQITRGNTSGEAPKSSDTKQASLFSQLKAKKRATCNITKGSFTLEAQEISIEIRVVIFQSNARH